MLLISFLNPSFITFWELMCSFIQKAQWSIDPDKTTIKKDPNPLQRATCFTQSTNSNTNIDCKQPQRHTQK